MISSARPAAAAASAGTTTAATQSADHAAAPFDSVLALETIAADANAAQLELLSTASAEGGLEELQEDLLTEDDADAEEGEELALGPLALLGMLMTVAIPVHSHGSSASAAEGIDDALASGGKASGQSPGDGAQLGLALTAPLQDAVGEAATDAADALLAATTAPVSSTDAAADAGRPTDALNRAAEWMTHGVRHGQASEHAPLTTHARDPRWAEEFGTRIALMVRGGESSASLQLTPVDLGPMEVSITVRDGQASVHFGAAQAETRALIEASIPRLREMLAAQGFNLMDASVSQGFSRQARPDAPRPAQLQSEPEAEARTVTRIESTRLLDTYA